MILKLTALGRQCVEVDLRREPGHEMHEAVFDEDRTGTTAVRLESKVSKCCRATEGK